MYHDWMTPKRYGHYGRFPPSSYYDEMTNFHQWNPPRRGYAGRRERAEASADNYWKREELRDAGIRSLDFAYAPSDRRRYAYVPQWRDRQFWRNAGRHRW